MSKDKPVATATIKFYPNKHVVVDLDGIATITPRALSIAHNMLNKKFRAMRGKHNADAHQAARKAAAEEKKRSEKEEADFHEKEDARLAEAAKSATERRKEVEEANRKELDEAKKTPKKEEKPKVEEKLPEVEVEAAETDDTPIEEVKTEEKK